MILVENSSSFTSSPESDFSAVSHPNPYADFDSSDLREPFLDLDEIDQLLFTEPDESKSATASDYFCNDLPEEEDFLEIDLSDSSSQDQEDDLSSLTPSVQRLFCQTSMSNYSSSSSVISSLVEDVGSRLNESRKTTILAKPDFNKSSYLFGGVFDNLSSCGSGSQASSTPSTPSSINGASFTTLPHPAVASSSALPSFSEIYSPRYKGGRHQFDSISDFFKFEDYISEGDSVSEGDENSTALLASAIEQLPCGQLNTNGAGFDLLHPQIILKEEPMDSFVPTTTAIESAMQLKQPIAKYCESFEHLTGLPKPGPFDAPKVEPEEPKEELIFRADSPKPMRYHLHSLSLNVMSGTNCETAPYDDTFETLESESLNRITANAASFEQGTSGQLSGMPLLMPGNSGMQSLMAPDATMDSSVMDISEGSGQGLFRGGKVRNQRSKSMQMQICAVCGDVAACQHYGVLTCEGCKGFFKRTVQKGSKYTCLGNKDCTVDKRRRNRCQFCRFQKCLAVGMVKEVVRTDSLKGRRGRLPSKPKMSQEMPIFPPLSTISALVKAHMETSTDKANLDFSQYSDTVASGAHELIDAQLLKMLNSSLNNLYTFMEKIPGFNEFSEHDRKLLFQNSCLELFALRMAYRIKPGSNYFILCNNIVMHRNQFAASFGEWLPLIEELSNQLHAIEIDISAFSCLCALTVITGRCGVQDLNKIDQLETKIINSLKDHTVYNSEAQKKPNYFSRILSKLSELRTIGELGHRVVMERLNQFDATNATADIRDLAKKFSAGFSVTSVEMESSMQADLACLDLPSISSFFKGWPLK